MKFSAENPRYIAYTNNAFGRTEAGRSNRVADAWKLAEAATKQAQAARPGINHDAEIFDKAANNGQGSLITRLKAKPAKVEFILVYLSSASEYDAPVFASRKAAQAYKDEQVVERGVEVMTRQQLAKYVAGAQQCDTPEEQDSLLDRILNR